MAEPRYVIIGDGAVAQHMGFYFKALSLSAIQWARSSCRVEDLFSALGRATHVLVLITDDAIDEFLRETLSSVHRRLTVVHFSGCHSSPFALSAHPLQTFRKNTLYTVEAYRRIPFAIEKKGPPFSQLLPGLSNPSFTVEASLKAYYHALCVLAQSTSAVVWESFYKEMGDRFGLRPRDLHPFLERTCENIKEDPSSALTGPLKRGDTHTLHMDLQALSSHNPLLHSVLTAITVLHKGEKGI